MLVGIAPHGSPLKRFPKRQQAVDSIGDLWTATSGQRRHSG
jgi:hypothetical protein